MWSSEISAWDPRRDFDVIRKNGGGDLLLPEEEDLILPEEEDLLLLEEEDLLLPEEENLLLPPEKEASPTLIPAWPHIKVLEKNGDRIFFFWKKRIFFFQKKKIFFF